MRLLTEWGYPGKLYRTISKIHDRRWLMLLSTENQLRYPEENTLIPVNAKSIIFAKNALMCGGQSATRSSHKLSELRFRSNFRLSGDGRLKRFLENDYCCPKKGTQQEI